MKKKCFDGYVSLRKWKSDYGFCVRSSSKEPKKSDMLIGYAKIIGTQLDPQKKWRDWVMSWSDKDYGFSDGVFSEKPPIKILEGISRGFEARKGLKEIDLFEVVSLYNEKCEIIEQISDENEVIKRMDCFIKKTRI